MERMILINAILGWGFFIWLLLLTIWKSMDNKYNNKQNDILGDKINDFGIDLYELNFKLWLDIPDIENNIEELMKKDKINMNILKELFELVKLLNEKIDLYKEFIDATNSDSWETDKCLEWCCDSCPKKVSVYEIDWDAFSELLEKHLTTKK